MNSKKILVIDDEEEIREIICFMLTRNGYQVTEASDGETALQLLKEQTFDLVLSDVLMPKGNGKMVLKKAKSEMKLATPFFMITGEPNCSVQELKDLGAKDVFIKPITQAFLLQKVAESL